jgi:4-hydroxy-tetrahydrodipicolinate synthase
MQLIGVWPALATALTPDEEIDTAGLARITEYCLSGGVYGVVVLGSTGEFPAMTAAMRERAIETVVQTVGGRLPVVAGCGESGTRRTIDQVRCLEGSGVDAVLVALPFYYPIDQAAVIRHYEAVAEASPLPVLLYNFPQMTKITIAPGTLTSLSAHPNIVGIKDSAGDFVGLLNYLAATEAADGFAVMCGNPALGLAAYIHGAAGGIFAGASLAPRLSVDVYEAFVAGEIGEAVELQRRATLLTKMGRFGANAAVIKSGLERMGICGSSPTAPLGLAAGDDIADQIDAWMKELGLNEPESVHT